MIKDENRYLIEQSLWWQWQLLRGALCYMDDAVRNANEVELNKHAEEAIYLLGSIESLEFVLKTPEEIEKEMIEADPSTITPVEGEIYRSDVRQALIDEIDWRRQMIKDGVTEFEDDNE